MGLIHEPVFFGSGLFSRNYSLSPFPSAPPLFYERMHPMRCRSLFFPEGGNGFKVAVEPFLFFPALFSMDLLLGPLSSLHRSLLLRFLELP